MVQTLWKSLQFLKGVKRVFYPAIPLLDIQQKEMKMCVCVFMCSVASDSLGPHENIGPLKNKYMNIHSSTIHTC